MKYVYVLKAGENKYKIGFSVNVKKRVKSIQTGNGDKIYVVMTKLCEHAELVEQKTHAYLRKYRLQQGGTEWFVLDPEDVIRVCILINHEPEIDVYENTDLNKQLAEQKLRHKRLEKKLDMILNIAQRQKPRTMIAPELPQLAEKLSKDELRSEAELQLINAAKEVLLHTGKASTSMLQVKLRIGYGRAARIMQQLEEQGFISSADGPRARKILQEQ